MNLDAIQNLVKLLTQYLKNVRVTIRTSIDPEFELNL